LDVLEKVNKSGKTNHVIFHRACISRHDRNCLNNHKSGLVWFTGLSASGKSTIAHNVEKELFKLSVRTYVLDGDNIRHGLNSDLGFGNADRKENIRRIVELSKLLVDAGVLVLAAFISPSGEDRKYIRKRFENDNFLQIYVKCSIEECEKRDPKGQYKRAREGIIRNYTGISAPYEEPEAPDLVIETEKMTLEDSVGAVIKLIKDKGLL
jgi:adenylylsulfate kinase